MTGILAALRESHFTCWGPAGVDDIDLSSTPDERDTRPPRGKFLETPRPRARFLPVPEIANNDPMLFRCFLDGSHLNKQAHYDSAPFRNRPLLACCQATSFDPRNRSESTLCEAYRRPTRAPNNSCPPAGNPDSAFGRKWTIPAQDTAARTAANHHGKSTETRARPRLLLDMSRHPPAFRPLRRLPPATFPCGSHTGSDPLAAPRP